MKLKIVLSSLLTFMVFVTCTEATDDDPNTQPSNFSLEDEKRSAQLDASTEASFNIVENGFVEATADDGFNSFNTFFPECAMITFAPNGDGTGSVSINFGEGCTLRDGNFVQGAINITYETVNETTRNFTYTYDNFFINSIGVSGGGTAVRTTSNINGFPQSTATENITVDFPNSDITGTRTATRIIVWAEGAGSGTWTDNVYEIDGDWETSLSNGFNRTGEVTTTLVRELSCPVVGSGVIEITQNNGSASLDYGDGTCDSIAILTFNGVDYEIFIGR